MTHSLTQTPTVEQAGAQFADTSTGGGDKPAQCREVFLQHNQLPLRWRGRDDFVIAELGFGNGLNFLATWQAWRQQPGTRLHYIAVEARPLKPDDLARSQAAWPELRELAVQLQQAWPLPLRGLHRREFENDRLRLTLIQDDIPAALKSLAAGVDAWFLNELISAGNPDMWQPAVIGAMQRHSAPDATFASCKTQPGLQQGLSAAGFTVQEIAGQKGKLLSGKRIGSALPPKAATSVVVVGAGLAGCATAAALASRGCQVTLMDRAAAPASAASGVPLAVLRPWVDGHYSPMAQWFCHGALYSGERLARQGWQPSGVLELRDDSPRALRRAARLRALALPLQLLREVSAEQASELAGVTVTRAGWYWPGAGCVQPAALCEQLLAGHAITWQQGIVRSFQRTADCWTVTDANGQMLDADHLVFAIGAELPPGTLPGAQAVRGQLSAVPANAASKQLQAGLCVPGHILPAQDGLHWLGASFIPNDRNCSVREEEHAQNLAHSSALLGYAGLQATHVVAGFAGLRAKFRDHLPAIGALQDGLWLNSGHGARGLASALLAAELVADNLCGLQLPVSPALAAAVSPTRRAVQATCASGS